MSKIPSIIPVTDLRQDAAKVLSRVRRTADPVVITQRGRAAGVLVSFEQYQRERYERDLLHALARGEQQIQQGDGHDLDSVLSEAEALLAERRAVRIRFTPGAREQFLAAIDYIRLDNPSAARKFRKRAETVLRRLSRFPNSGRVVPEFPDLPFREVIVPPYRFFYRKKHKTIWIAAVWHAAQIPEPRNAE